MADGMNLRLSRSTVESLHTAIATVAEDDREPERYRQMYTAALLELEAEMKRELG